jgi:CRP-like cAMP-binding protein
MLAAHRKSGNDLLNALPDEAWHRLVPHLDPTAVPLGQVLVGAGASVRDVYFPSTAIVSLLHVMASGHTTEVATVGREGMTDVMACLGAERSIHQATVQNAGHAYRMSLKAFKADFDRGGALTQAVLRYTQLFIGQLAQTATCNRHGTLEQRLCRWLLLNFDRVADGELTMTHEQIAQALGVKREGVTEAAGRLRRDGAIDYRRGHIKALDRPVLEGRACECYVRATRPLESPWERGSAAGASSPRPSRGSAERPAPLPAYRRGQPAAFAVTHHEP